MNWKHVLEEIKYNLKPSTFEIWFSESRGEIKNETLHVYVELESQKYWIEARYINIILKAMVTVTGKAYPIEIVSDELYEERQRRNFEEKRSKMVSNRIRYLEKEMLIELKQVTMNTVNSIQDDEDFKRKHVIDQLLLVVGKIEQYESLL
ncbi:chromosomal replication initiation ATPase DnaA [Bacillus pakistanensis]|uniref:Chromosomal replication initiation ATPase DnaA n=1 Tax=Rossellomorea pakistanensis TaxID=992288 RepID=A0ABS2NJJ2_9BACI|nr:DnaA N-terminal domain-containing protein [Bacillus pakistanensis]MBM7587929.1 chromosomal replication initiation ATPase DnaA [Bacillus pakistanensis]